MLKCPVIAMLATAALTAHAHAQCEGWLIGPFASLPTGITGGNVEAVTTWDPDGGGPQPLHMVIAGDFSVVHGVAMQGIAVWNGEVWASLGDPPGEVVRDLAIFGGSLIACGDGNVSRWVPGQGWLQFGSVVGQAEVMTIFNGELIVGGTFTSIGGPPMNNIARWNGSVWQALGATPLGGGVQSSGPLSRVRTLAVFNGQLIVGGEFNIAGPLLLKNIAGWNGSSWFGLGEGLFLFFAPVGHVSGVRALAVFQGSLFAGGKFDRAGSITNHVRTIARWDGAQWFLTGTVPEQLMTIDALAVEGASLYAGGTFQSINTSPPGIARFDGTDWWGVGNGIPPQEVFAIDVYAADLYVAGEDPPNLKRWDGTSWGGAPNNPHEVKAFAQLGQRMVAAGHYVQPTTPGSGAPVAYHVAAWDGPSNTLGAMGSGLDGPAYALLSFVQPGPGGGRELIAGGNFTTAGGLPAARVARWVEDPLGFPPPAWAPMGAGFSSVVDALERFKGATVAAGHFTFSGGTPVNRIARWDGAAWQPITSGLDGRARALKAGPGPTLSTATLIVGGEFTTAGGLAANRIARWTESLLVPGGSWDAMGAGFNNTVRAIERHDNSTYAAGEFTASGATPLSRVARWSGSAWVDVGGGLNGAVHALESSGGFLYAGGQFTLPASSVRVARWNGTAWSPVVGGMGSASVLALGTYHGEIHAGTGGGSQWNRYTLTAVPPITTQPTAQTFACGESAQFSVAVVQGYVASHQWRRNGAALSNGPTGTGSTIAGATSILLTIGNVSQADEADYDVATSNSCGAVTSVQAGLTVTGTCPGPCYPDCNTDGTLTVADFGCFQTKFVINDPYADCNTSGALTVADFGCFQTKFVTGCP